MTKRIALWSVCLVVVLSALPAWAGFYTEHQTVVPNPITQQTITKTVRAWHDGKKFKKENPLNGETIIIDLDSDMVYGVNYNAKTFWQLKSDEYQRLATIQLFAMGVTANPDGTITVSDNLFTPTGKTKTVEGKNAYEVNINYPPVPNVPAGQGMKTSIWMSEDVKLPKEKLIDELRISLNNPKGPEYKKFFAQWRKLDGYPVQTETTLSTPKGEIKSTETLKVYRKEKIPASAFKVPKGYKKTVDPITRLQQMQRQMMERRQQQQQGGTAGGLGAPPPQGGKEKRVKKAGAK